MPDQSRVAIAAGAECGIGTAVAERLDQDGHRVARAVVPGPDTTGCEPVVDTVGIAHVAGVPQC
ncbi:hypothetical protein [Streptomyces spinosirectus]